MSSRGFLRWRLAKSLSSAYAVGLLTQDTFAHRLDHLYGGSLVDPQQLIGDLTFRRRRTTRRPRGALIAAALRRRSRDDEESEGAQLPILGLDWTGASSQLLVGRGSECDLMVPGRTVSRRHAQLLFREGRWILVDLDSTNGTYINGDRVRRAELFPGDVVALGVERLLVD